MSDLCNVGARIVPLTVANNFLIKKMGPGVELPYDEYARVQLPTEEAAREVVDDYLRLGEFATAYAALKYGELSYDFPLCADFARIFVALITLACDMAGWAARGFFFRLHYTMNEIDEQGRHKRHAINGVVLADGRVLFLEPQGLRWLDEPRDLKSYDKVRL